MTEKTQTMDLQKLIKKTPLDLGVDIGKKTAPKRMIVFANIACPFCRRWILACNETLKKQTKAGRLYVQFLFWNRANLKLINGNIAHHYLKINDNQTFTTILNMYQKQSDLRAQPDESAVIKHLSNKYHLKRQNVQYPLDLIRKIAMEANLKSVPTIIIDNKAFGSDSLSNEKLKQILEK